MRMLANVDFGQPSALKPGLSMVLPRRERPFAKSNSMCGDRRLKIAEQLAEPKPLTVFLSMLLPNAILRGNGIRFSWQRFRVCGFVGLLVCWSREPAAPYPAENRQALSQLAAQVALFC